MLMANRKPSTRRWPGMLMRISETWKRWVEGFASNEVPGFSQCLRLAAETSPLAATTKASSESNSDDGGQEIHRLHLFPRSSVHICLTYRGRSRHPSPAQWAP